MKIELELTYLGEETIDQAVIRQAAERLLTLGRGRDETLEGLRERVRAIEDEEIRAAVAPRVREAIEAALQPTNEWGVPKGEPVTLLDYIVQEGVKLLTAPARNDYDTRRTDNIVKKLIKDEVERALQNELSTHIAAAKAEISNAVKEKGAEVLAETIQKLAAGR